MCLEGCECFYIHPCLLSRCVVLLEWMDGDVVAIREKLKAASNVC